MLSDANAPGLFGGNRIFVQRDSRGRYFTTTLMFDAIAVFDSTGRFEKTVGRSGSGPGEYRFAMIAAPLADSMLVHDNRLGRVTVLTPELEVGRIFELQQFPLLPLQDGTILLTQQVRTADRIGYPAHVADATGRVIRSFGTDRPEYRSDLAPLLGRVAGPARDGMIWLVPPGRYLPEKWDPQAGRRILQLSVDADWFRTYTAPVGHPLFERPDSRIEHIREDGAGFLWLLIRTADAKWRARLAAEPTTHDADSEMTPERMAEAYDWILEVRNSRDGSLLARHVFDAEIWTRPPGQLFVRRKPSDSSPDIIAYEIIEMIVSTVQP